MTDQHHRQATGRSRSFVSHKDSPLLGAGNHECKRLPALRPARHGNGGEGYGKG
ncbi:MAG: hypothetical protein Q8L84_08170 [Hyphomonas sp.]|nr:hypothetical protein [Hyphomonas sp.]